MSGKGDKPRNNFSEQYRSNYDNIFRKKIEHLALPPIKIFFDLDECLIHSEYERDQVNGCKSCDDDFLFDIGTRRVAEIYRTKVRPGTRDVLAFARMMVGAENVYVLTASTEPYANQINIDGKLGFTREQIFHRQHIADAYHKVKDSPEFRPCILIDNLHYNDNQSKAYYLRIDSTDYYQVEEYLWDRDEDPKFIERVQWFIDYRVKHYNHPENR